MLLIDAPIFSSDFLSSDFFWLADVALVYLVLILYGDN